MTASTTAVSFATKKRGIKLSNKAVTAMTFDLALVDADLEENDILEVGYVPAGVTVFGFLITISDLDTDVSPAHVCQVQLGTTALVAGLTTGQGGGSDIYACVPTTTTAATVVRFKTTTAPTAAAETGTVQITALYYSAS